MRKLFLLGILILFLAACGGEEPEGANADAPEETTETKETSTEPEGSEDTETMTAEENENQEASVGDTITSEIGEQSLVSRTDDVDTLETGPIVLNIEKANGVSAQLSSEYAEMMETQQLEYIQVDMEVENTSDEDISFYASQATLTTDTGEQLEPDMLMSDHIDGDFMGAVTKSGTSYYFLENSKAEDVESIRLIYSAPHDMENYDDVGEEIDIEVPLEN